MALILPNHIANATPADGDKLQQNYSTIVDWANEDVVVIDGSKAMTGPLLLPGPPVQPNQAATKGYVDQGVPVAAMTMFAGDVAPTNWMFCRGQAVSRATYAALFAAIGSRFGAGDGATTFNLPNMQGTAPVGHNTNTNPPAGLAGKFTSGVGERGGSTDSALPAHDHATIAHTHGLGGHVHAITDHIHYPQGSPGATNFLNVTNIGVNSFALNSGPAKLDYFTSTGGMVYPVNSGGPSGGSDAAAPNTDVRGVSPSNTNLQPYLTVNFVIKVL